MKSKTLRVCLSMGGGVSLGTFSGSALTEALKFLILYGQDKNGNPYDKVVLDGMSGASAGAIALTIMLKTLIDYKAMMKVYNQKVESYEGKTDEELIELTGTKHRDQKVTEETLIQELADIYFQGNTSSIKAHPKREQLKALQLAQKVQRQIWTKQLTVKNLYGAKLNTHKLNPHDSFALLHREVLIKSAQFYLTDDLSFNLNNNAQVLDKHRVVFACSLTNLVPIEIEKELDGKKQPILKQNAFKSTGSQNHAELRVFDFVFDNETEDKKPTDDCWFQIANRSSANKRRNEGMNLTFSDPKTWRILASSALACGAFPFAFEPVVLKRYKQEYEEFYWPKVFDSILKDTPKDRVEKSFFDEVDDNNQYQPIDYKSFNFPYIDGGTFNNEPIREAFKIGSFQDFGNEYKDYDRLILFVDPAVRQEKYSSFNVGSYQSISTDVKLGITSFKNEFSKLIGNIGSTVGLLANQGSIKEEHRIRDKEESIGLREELFEYIHDNELIHKKITIRLIARAFNKIDINLKQGSISLGTRSVIKYFENELQKVCSNLFNKIDECHIITQKQLYGIKEGIEEGKIKDDVEQGSQSGIEKLFNILNKGKYTDDEVEERKVLFAQTVFRVLTDFSLRTVGKDAKAEYMAILPISPEGFQTIELPGAEVQAFAGFASYPSREYAFEYGRLSTLESLMAKKDGFRDAKKGYHPIISHKTLGDIKKDLKFRILNLEFYKKSYDYEEDIKRLYNLSIRRLMRLLKKPEGKRPFSFKKLGNSFLSLIKTSVVGIAAILPFKNRTVPWLLKFKTNKIANEIKYKKLLPITISILSDRKLSKKVKFEFQNKNAKSTSLKIIERPTTGKGNKRKYQYLFQLHYLEYINWGHIELENNQPKSESVAVNKIDPENVEFVGLAVKNKIFNPSIDNNINYKDWRKAFEEESEKIEIKNIKLDGMILGDLKKELNNKNTTLHYSLKNLNYHISPMLEYDINDSNIGWYFKDNTKAFYHNLS